MMTTGQTAGMGPRLIALIIDSILVGVIVGIVSVVLGLVGLSTTTVTTLNGTTTAATNSLGTIVSFITALIYYTVSWSQRNGQTIGDQLLGIRVIKMDGSAVSPVSAALRYIGYIINTTVLFIGWIWAFFNPEKRGWHDLIAGTRVVTAK